MIALLTILALAVLWYVWARGRRQAQSGHVYFLHAVKVYALTGDEDAKMAALAAGRLAAARQRALMLDFLNKRSSELLLETAEDNAGRNPLVVVDRLLHLKHEIAAQTAATDAAQPELTWLRDHNRAYLRALERGDAQVFVTRHPDLFATRSAAAASAARKDEPV